jgi:thiol-disulfide isomerase/thioredoxin
MSVKWARLVLLGLILIVLSGMAWQPAQAQVDGPKYKTVLYFFWGDGCPHCAHAKPWLEELSDRYPELEIRSYEVWNDRVNQGLFLQMLERYQVPEPYGVPTFFIGEYNFTGFYNELQTQLEAVVELCIHDGCADPGAGIIPGASGDPPQAVASVASGTPDDSQGRSITLPLIGRIDLSNQSLFVSTALIAFVDGFNPCSLWVLSMLLALTLHTGDRKKIVIIGFIFITVTAAVYALFIAGLFTFLTITSFAWWIQALVALVALFFAIVNIKDYFWYKEGLSFTIADEKKPGIYKRIRNVMDASHSFWGLAGATVVLAAGVSLVEFSCTAGFPVVWTNLLASHGVTAGTFVGLLLVYMLIYQLDELAIFFTAVFTLRASRMEEKHGRILKLVGGMLMLTLAIVMLYDPHLMNDLGTSMLIFGLAFGGALLVLLVHRVILPSFGVWVGTEEQKAGKPEKSRKTPRH